MALREGDPLGVAVTDLQLGRIARARGLLPAARTHFDRSRPVLHRIGYRRGEAMLLLELGLLEKELGRQDKAAVYLSESADLFGTLGHGPGQGQALEALESLREDDDEAQTARTSRWRLVEGEA
jgi:hypothetical protein